MRSSQASNSIDPVINNETFNNITTPISATELKPVEAQVIDENLSNHNQLTNPSESKEQRDIRLVEVAVRNDDVEGVERFLNQYPMPPRRSKRSPAQLKSYELSAEAAEHGSINVIKLILKKNLQKSHYNELFSDRIKPLIAAIKSHQLEIVRLITENFTIHLDEKEAKTFLDLAANLRATNNNQNEEFLNVIEKIITARNENIYSTLEIPKNRNFLHEDFISKTYPHPKEWLIHPKGYILILDSITKAFMQTKTIFALDLHDMFNAYLWFKENSNVQFANIFYRDPFMGSLGHQALYRFEKIGYEIKIISLDSAPRESIKVVEGFNSLLDPSALLNAEFILPSNDYVQQTDVEYCGIFSVENLKRLPVDRSFYQELVQKHLLIFKNNEIKRYYHPARFASLMSSWKQLKAFEDMVYQEAKEIVKFDTDGKGLTARDCFLEKRVGAIKNPVALKNRNTDTSKEKIVYKNTYITYCAYQYITEIIPNYLSAYENRKDELASIIESYTVNSRSISAESLALIKSVSDSDDSDSSDSDSNQASNNNQTYDNNLSAYDSLTEDNVLLPNDFGDTFLNIDAFYQENTINVITNEASEYKISEAPSSSCAQVCLVENTNNNENAPSQVNFSSMEIEEIENNIASDSRESKTNKRKTEGNSHPIFNVNNSLNQLNMFSEAGGKKQKSDLPMNNQDVNRYNFNR